MDPHISSQRRDIPHAVIDAFLMVVVAMLVVMSMPVVPVIIMSAMVVPVVGVMGMRVIVSVNVSQIIFAFWLVIMLVNVFVDMRATVMRVHCVNISQIILTLGLVIVLVSLFLAGSIL